MGGCIFATIVRVAEVDAVWLRCAAPLAKIVKSRAFALSISRTRSAVDARGVQARADAATQSMRNVTNCCQNC